MPPPPFTGFDLYDPLFFRKWVKKVRVFQYQNRFHKPSSELALDLHAAISGDAADELEPYPLEWFVRDDGIDIIINILEDAGFDTDKIVYQGAVMKEYENFKRYASESYFDCIRRFRRIENKLPAVELTRLSDEMRVATVTAPVLASP